MHILAEVSLGGLAKAANREAAAIAQINVVGVELENLLLREPLVDFHRHQHFFRLAAPLAFRGEEERPRHLHVDGAGALRLLSPAYVVERGAEHANEVQRSMLEEALVLRGQHGVEQILRQIVEPDDAPLLARTVEEIGQHLRLDVREIALHAAGNLHDPRNVRTGEVHPNRVVAFEVGVFRGPDFDGRLGDAKLPGRAGHAAFLITGMDQVLLKIGLLEGFARVDASGSGIDARGILVNLVRSAARSPFSRTGRSSTPARR